MLNKRVKNCPWGGCKNTRDSFVELYYDRARGGPEKAGVGSGVKKRARIWATCLKGSRSDLGHSYRRFRSDLGYSYTGI